MTGAGSACAVEVRVIIQRRGVYVALNPGELIGPYRVVAQIGQGGMGSVFLVERNDGHFAQTAALIGNALVFFENLAHEKPKEILLSADESVAVKLGEAIEKTAHLRPTRWSPADGLAFADDAAKGAFKASEMVMFKVLAIV